MKTAALGRDLSRQTHVVRVVHATTGRPLDLSRPTLEPAAAGWRARFVRGTGVVVSSTQRVPEGVSFDDVPAPTVPPALVVRVVGPRVDRLRVPSPTDRPRHTLVVNLSLSDQVVAVPPLETRLTVVLVGREGDPSVGRTVTLEPAGGPGAALTIPESPPGAYTSPPTAWSSAFWPAHIAVDGEIRRTVHPGVYRDASVELVDTA